MSEPAPSTTALPLGTASADHTDDTIQKTTSTSDDGAATPTVETPIGSADLSATPLTEASLSLSSASDDDDDDATDPSAAAATAATTSEPHASDAKDSGSDDSDGDAIVEAATPSSMSFVPLESPAAELGDAASASSTDEAIAVAAAAVLATTAAVAAVSAANKPSNTSEATSDDLMEQAANSNDKAATSGDATSNGTASGSDASATAATDAAATADTDDASTEKKRKHTNVDEATAKVLEGCVAVAVESSIRRTRLLARVLTTPIAATACVCQTRVRVGADP